MSTATLTKKELFVQGSLTTDVAEMIEMLAVNVPGVKSCNVNAVNKSLVLSIDTTKDEGAVINIIINKNNGFFIKTYYF